MVPPPATAPQIEPQQRTVAEVGLDNAAFIAEEKEKGFDGKEEEAALRRIFKEFEEVCKRKLGGRWEAVKGKFKAREWDGEDVRRVVDKLEAPHLKPTGILERMRGGVDAAAFGVATLISNL